MTLNKIIVYLPGAKLGDFLMTTPALSGLKSALPGLHITLMLWPSGRGPWFSSNTFLTRDLRAGAAVSSELYSDYIWDDKDRAYRGLRGTLLLLKRLRAERYDAAVMLHSGSRYAWLFRLAGIPVRIGSTRKYYHRLFTQNIEMDRGAPDRHEVEFNFDMMRPLGAVGQAGPMSFPATEADLQSSREILSAYGWRGEPYIVVNPSHGGSSRRWPEERFAAAANSIASEHNLTIVLTGTVADTDVNVKVSTLITAPVIDLTGKTSIGALAAVLSKALLHVSVDTGTSHLAAALGTPCVTVFPFFEHWNQRLRWQPWKTASRLVGPSEQCIGCQPGSCLRQDTKCIDSVKADDVVEAARSLIEAANSGVISNELAANKAAISKAVSTEEAINKKGLSA